MRKWGKSVEPTCIDEFLEFTNPCHKLNKATKTAKYDTKYTSEHYQILELTQS